jgi:hypothetical protein
MVIVISQTLYKPVRAIAVLGCRRAAMDVGMTRSQRSSPFHWAMGIFVVTVGYSAVMFAIRAFVMR